MKATIFTILALLAFAANSLLCRMALAQGHIDAWNFTLVRLLSGAVCLAVIMALYSYHLKRNAEYSEQIKQDTGSWLSSFSLVIYALCFSIAYLALDTGTGALILFSAVQLTMMGWGIYNKEQLNPMQWTAFVVAIAGFVYLMLPSAAIPSLLPASLMALSGVAWGIYSIRGKACVSPIRATGFNFIRSMVALPLFALVGFSFISEMTMAGFLLACASGAVASGMGYSIWYVAMPLLKSTQAAVVQLCVPVLAALAGRLILAEPLTMQFIVSSSVILSAVLVFILNKQSAQKKM